MYMHLRISWVGNPRQKCDTFVFFYISGLRAIGIPARSVTNFSSAHDTDGSCTIDTIIGPEGDEIDCSDSVWYVYILFVFRNILFVLSF